MAKVKNPQPLWDLSDLLPGVKAGATFGEQVQATQKMSDVQLKALEKIIAHAGDLEERDSLDAPGVEKLIGVANRLFASQTQLKNLNHWVALQETQYIERNAESIAEARETHSLLTVSCSVAEQGIKNALEKHLDVIMQPDLWLSQTPFFRAQLVNLFPGLELDYEAPTAASAKPTFAMKRLSQIGEPWEEYAAAYQDADLQSAKRLKEDNFLAKVLMKRTREARTTMAEAGVLGANLHRFRDLAYGVPRKLSRKYSDINTDLGHIPVGDTCPYDADKMTFDEMKTAVIERFSEFRPVAGDLARKALDKGWIATEENPNIPDAGFSYEPATSRAAWKKSHPYIYMPFDGSIFSTLSVAHELGHLVQQDLTPYYSREQSLQSPPLTETFAIVMERLLTPKLLDKITDPERKMDIAKRIAVFDSWQVVNGAGIDQLAEAIIDLPVELQKPPSGKEMERITQQAFEHLPEEMQTDLGYSKHTWRTNSIIYMPGYGPEGVVAHGIGAMGARAFADHYFSLDREGQRDMADWWVEVMKHSVVYEKGWADALEVVGVNIKQPGFIERIAEYPKRMLEKVSKETGVALEEELRPKQGHAQKLAASREKRKPIER